MFNEAQFSVAGYVATDPVYPLVGDGIPRLRMRVSWTTRRRDPATGEWADANTSWIWVTCWRRLADNLHACLRKGDPVILRGRLDVRTFVGKDEQAWQLVAPVTQFVIGSALSHLKIAIAVDRHNGIVIAGTDDFFMTEISSLSASSATVTTCDNGSRITGMRKATGQIDNAYAPSKDEAYLLEHWNMVPHAGHWALTSFSIIQLPDPRAQPCQPSSG